MSLEKGVLTFEELQTRIGRTLADLGEGLRCACTADGLVHARAEQRIYVCAAAFNLARDPITLSQRPVTVLVAIDRLSGDDALILMLGVPGVGYLMAYSDRVAEERRLDHILNETTVNLLYDRLRPFLTVYLEPTNPKHWSPRGPGAARP